MREKKREMTSHVHMFFELLVVYIRNNQSEKLWNNIVQIKIYVKVLD